MVQVNSRIPAPMALQGEFSTQPSQARLNQQAALTGAAANYSAQEGVVRETHKQKAMTLVAQRRSPQLLREIRQVKQKDRATHDPKLYHRDRGRIMRDEEGQGQPEQQHDELLWWDEFKR